MKNQMFLWLVITDHVIPHHHDNKKIWMPAFRLLLNGMDGSPRRLLLEYILQVVSCHLESRANYFGK